MNDLENVKDKLRADETSTFYVSESDRPLIDAIKEEAYTQRKSYSRIIMEALKQVYERLLKK